MLAARPRPHTEYPPSGWDNDNDERYAYFLLDDDDDCIPRPPSPRFIQSYKEPDNDGKFTPTRLSALALALLGSRG